MPFGVPTFVNGAWVSFWLLRILFPTNVPWEAAGYGSNIWERPGLNSWLLASSCLTLSAVNIWGVIQQMKGNDLDKTKLGQRYTLHDKLRFFHGFPELLKMYKEVSVGSTVFLEEF